MEWSPAADEYEEQEQEEEGLLPCCLPLPGLSVTSATTTGGRKGSSSWSWSWLCLCPWCDCAKATACGMVKWRALWWPRVAHTKSISSATDKSYGEGGRSAQGSDECSAIQSYRPLSCGRQRWLGLGRPSCRLRTAAGPRSPSHWALDNTEHRSPRRRGGGGP